MQSAAETHAVGGLLDPPYKDDNLGAKGNCGRLEARPVISKDPLDGMK
jgi:hypothetical protein